MLYKPFKVKGNHIYQAVSVWDYYMTRDPTCSSARLNPQNYGLCYDMLVACVQSGAGRLRNTLLSMFSRAPGERTRMTAFDPGLHLLQGELEDLLLIFVRVLLCCYGFFRKNSSLERKWQVPASFMRKAHLLLLAMLKVKWTIENNSAVTQHEHWWTNLSSVSLHNEEPLGTQYSNLLFSHILSLRVIPRSAKSTLCISMFTAALFVNSRSNTIFQRWLK